MEGDEMGYRTHYSIKVLPPSRYDAVRGAIAQCDGGYDPLGGECCKWYEHDTETAEVSAKYPDALILLDGEGEEPGDIWRTAFHGGKMVWRWKLDATIPSPPAEVLALAASEEDVASADKRARIQALKDELAALTGEPE